MLLNVFDQPEEEEDQQFIADYEDCTTHHKSFADRPFVIPHIPFKIIDKIMMKGNIGNTDDKYIIDYHIRGILHLYRDQTVRITHGLPIWQQKEMRLLGRAIQATYN